MVVNIKKHINQIKKGGLIVIIKKLRTTFYLLTQVPFYLFSIPLLVLIYLIRPWLLIRWHGLYCSRIGHFALDTELYFCRRDAKINQPTQKYIDIFFLGNKYVCNKQLLKMFRRKLTIELFLSFSVVENLRFIFALQRALFPPLQLLHQILWLVCNHYSYPCLNPKDYFYLRFLLIH